MLLSRRGKGETSIPRTAGPGFRDSGADAACLTLGCWMMLDLFLLYAFLPDRD
jgi:hypothetical protein